MNCFLIAYYALLALSVLTSLIVRLATDDEGTAMAAAWTVRGVALIVLVAAERARKQGKVR
jgi:hypothetical protein